jgi:hypothetical protein
MKASMILNLPITRSIARRSVDAPAALYAEVCTSWLQDGSSSLKSGVLSFSKTFPTWRLPHIQTPKNGIWSQETAPQNATTQWNFESPVTTRPALFWMGIGEDGHPTSKSKSRVAVCIDSRNTVVLFLKDPLKKNTWKPIPFVGTLDQKHIVSSQKNQSTLSYGAGVDYSGRKLVLVLTCNDSSNAPLTSSIEDVCGPNDPWIKDALHIIGQRSLEIALSAPDMKAPTDTLWDERCWPPFLPRCDFDISSLEHITTHLTALITCLHSDNPSITHLKFTPKTYSNTPYLYTNSNTPMMPLLDTIFPNLSEKIWQVHEQGTYIRLMPAATLIVRPEKSSHGVITAFKTLKDLHPHLFENAKYLL